MIIMQIVYPGLGSSVAFQGQPQNIKIKIFLFCG